MSALEAFTNAVRPMIPVLRRGSETEQGPHRSATPESTHMEPTPIFLSEQGRREVVSTVEWITPETARRLRDTAHFDRQRNISRINVERLATEISEGNFVKGTQIYIAVLPDGSERIINGNHTLEAVAHCGIPQLLTVTRAAVPDENAAGRIYAVFDIQKVRTWGDSLRASGMGDDIPNAKYVLSAIGAIENDFYQASLYKAGARSRLHRLERLDEYRVAAEMWSSAVAGAPSESVRLIRRSVVMAVALETFRYQPSAAMEFWGRCAHDDGLTVGMPEKALLIWLRNNKMGASVVMREAAKATALAWNAAFRGDERHYVKPGAMGSFFLLGTPLASGLGA